jgi:hypothetical protein
VPDQAGGIEEVLERDLLSPVYALTRKAAYFVRTADRALCEFPLPGGPARNLGVLPGFQAAPEAWLQLGFTVSPDDSSIVWAIGTGEESDLELIRNFR